MKKVNLIYETWKQDQSPRKYNGGGYQSVPNLDMENLYIELIEKVNNGEKVYVQFSDNHEKRPGAIALVKKITGDPFESRSYQNYYNKTETIYEDKMSNYTFHLKWEDRKNTATVQVRSWRIPRNSLFYLPDYDGPTVWKVFDSKKFAEKHADPVCDRLGNELSEGDTVVYINARYGSGAELDFGIVKEIDQKGKTDYRGNRYIETKLKIETIATSDDEKVMMSTIKKPERSVFKLTDVDLYDEAFVRKLTVSQE